MIQISVNCSSKDLEIVNLTKAPQLFKLEIHPHLQLTPFTFQSIKLIIFLLNSIYK